MGAFPTRCNRFDGVVGDGVADAVADAVADDAVVDACPGSQASAVGPTSSWERSQLSQCDNSNMSEWLKLRVVGPMGEECKLGEITCTMSISVSARFGPSGVREVLEPLAVHDRGEGLP